jgi:hypothetical protein
VSLYAVRSEGISVGAWYGFGFAAGTGLAGFDFAVVLVSGVLVGGVAAATDGAISTDITDRTKHAAMLKNADRKLRARVEQPLIPTPLGHCGPLWRVARQSSR